MDYRIEKKNVYVSKNEYMEHWKQELKWMKQHLTSTKIAATKEINKRKKEIAEKEKELEDMGAYDSFCI